MKFPALTTLLVTCLSLFGQLQATFSPELLEIPLIRWYDTFQKITSIPLELKTYENTIDPWIQFSNDMQTCALEWIPLLEQGGEMGVTSYFKVREIYTIYQMMTTLEEFHNHLIACASLIANNGQSDPAQKAIADELLAHQTDPDYFFTGTYGSNLTEEAFLSALSTPLP